jgi:hypothetical protein
MSDLATQFGGTVTAAPPAGRSGDIDVILEGGPVDFPEEFRNRRVPRTQDKVKVAYLGGYEHFERDPAAGPVQVYRWTARTRVAE